MRQLATVLMLCALAFPAMGQSTGPAATEGRRALAQAEAELKDTIERIEDGRVSRTAASSRLRQALNEVERAMMQLPSEARRGPAWQEAVKHVTDAMALVREEQSDPEAARAAARQALGALPALKGEDTGTGSS